MTAPESDWPDWVTPADCDLNGYDFMPLDVRRLRDSGIAAHADAEVFRASVLLWCAAWHQVPAGSLANDDRELASLAGFGRFVNEWLKVRDEVLKGFTMCPDGRLYHMVVCEKARAAWGERRATEVRSARGAAAKWRSDHGQTLAQKHAKTRSERLAAARAKGRHTEAEWSALVAFCGTRCVKCGAEGKLVKDHIVPIYQGGSDGIENLQPLCVRCNSAKGPDDTDHRPADWRQCVPSASQDAPQNACERLLTQETPGNRDGEVEGNIPPLPPEGAQALALEAEQPAKPDDVQVAFDEWNALAQRIGLPAARALSDDRRRAIQARLKVGGLALWREALKAVEASAFLRGQRPGSGGQPFKADLAFVCQAKSFSRLIDGGYGQDAREEAPTRRPGPPASPWPSRIKEWRVNAHWNRLDWGPPPGKPGCEVPPEILMAHGYVPTPLAQGAAA